MPTSPQFRRVSRRAGIDRVAGLPQQFARTDRGDWLFRRYGYGPAIPVSDDEYARFMRAGLRAVVVHGIALAVFGVLAWLLLARLLPDWGDNGRALVFGVVLPLIALVLHISLGHYADAPTRALAGRSPVRPACDPDDSMQPHYRSIVGFVVVLLLIAAMATRQTPATQIALASAALTIGVILAFRRLRFENYLTPPQRTHLKERRVAEAVAERNRKRQSEPLWKSIVLILFVIVELATLGAGIVLGVGAALAVTGQTSEQAGFGVFMLGFAPGLIGGGMLFVPLERLCNRWTGYSAIQAFDWLPPSW